jgi:hypothetical protein
MDPQPHHPKQGKPPEERESILALTRREPAGHAPSVATHQHVIEIAQVPIDTEVDRQCDAFKDLSNLARRECLAGALHSQPWRC